MTDESSEPDMRARGGNAGKTPSGASEAMGEAKKLDADLTLCGTDDGNGALTIEAAAALDV